MKQTPRVRQDEKPRRRTFFAVATLAIPILFFVALELALRLAGYGPDLSLFEKETINGRDYLNLNPDVQFRYFTRHQFSLTTAPSYFLSPKRTGTYRIFCLGGSTTVGYPYWYNGAFSSFLRDRLQRIFPRGSFDIINVGMTATNSFTVDDMAADIVKYQPDLLVVYDGHNEFYGAMGIASHESLGSIRRLTNLTLRLIHFKTFYLLRDLLGRISSLFQHSEPNASQQPLMEILASGQYVPFRSNVYNAGLDIFRGNLEDLRRLAEENHLPVIVASQVSNLRDQQPFVSLDDPTLSAAQRRQFHLHFDNGLRLRGEGHFSEAITEFGKALAVDSAHADCRYALARCLDTLGEYSAAMKEYVKARDFDQLRFRASTDFNASIRSAADNRWMFFADMESTFTGHSPDSLIGNSLILEHLHPNSRGSFLLAKEYVRVMRAHGLLATADEWQSADTIPDEVLWRARSVTRLDELIAERRTDVLTSGWPFKNQVPIVDAIPPNDTLRFIAEQVTRRIWGWPQAHEAAGAYYLSRRDLDDAAEEYRVLIDQLPMIDVTYYLQLGQILLSEGRKKEFGETLRASLEVRPTISAYRALGDLALDEGDPENAIMYYEKMGGFEQSNSERAANGYALAVAYAGAHRTDQAVRQILAVLSIQPSYQPALKLLQQIKGNTGRAGPGH